MSLGRVGYRSPGQRQEFKGEKAGMVFQKGKSGVGYYPDCSNQGLILPSSAASQVVRTCVPVTLCLDLLTNSGVASRYVQILSVNNEPPRPSLSFLIVCHEAPNTTSRPATVADRPQVLPKSDTAETSWLNFILLCSL